MAALLGLGIVGTLSVQQLFSKPESHSMEFLKYHLEQIDKKIEAEDKIINRANTNIGNRDERIKKDSLAIMLSDRHYRDSIRNLINPPD